MSEEIEADKYGASDYEENTCKYTNQSTFHLDYPFTFSTIEW